MRPAAAGLVLSRLVPALPAPLAAGLFESLLEDTLEASRACIADERTLWRTDAPALEPAPTGFELRRQQGADPGDRLAHAASALMRESGDRVVMVSTGIPGMRAEHLNEAFEALESADLVLGPATDGGCWLVGLAREVPALFSGLARGVPNAFDRTLSGAARAGLSVRTVTMLDGLETPHELVRLLAADTSGPPHAFGPNARSYLSRSGMLPA